MAAKAANPWSNPLMDSAAQDQTNQQDIDDSRGAGFVEVENGEGGDE